MTRTIHSITLGYKMAGLLSAVERHRVRLSELRPRVLTGEFGGATGTLASLGERGLDTQAGLMEDLRLAQPDTAWRINRDRVAEVGCFLALLTGTLGKLATDVKLLMQTEVGEAFEERAPVVSRDGAGVTVRVMKMDEDLMIASHTQRLIAQRGAHGAHHARHPGDL